MKKYMVYLLLATAPLALSGHAYAGSNNGYTSAANVYTGSSSRTWYGGGVAHVLAEWKKEADVPETVEVAAPAAGVSAMEAPSAPEGLYITKEGMSAVKAAEAPATPSAPEKPEAAKEATESAKAVELDAPVAPKMPTDTVEKIVVPKAEVGEGVSAKSVGATSDIPERPEAITAPDSPVEPKMDSN